MLEAAVLGTPIVATRCPGGVPEILEGVPGAWLAEKIDAESIADALCQALCSGRAGPRRSSRHILQKVNLRRVVHEYESLLAGEPLSVSQS
jgi:glycosyltransferase involved in cell wall biosynthesis